MKSTLYLLFASSLIIFSGCNKKNTSDSIWVEAYSIYNDNIIDWPSNQSLLNFHQDTVYRINLFDNANYNRIHSATIDTLEFNKSNQVIKNHESKFPILINLDTLTVQFQNRKVVYLKLKEEWKNSSQIELTKKKFRFKNKLFQYSYEFINDSVLIQFVKNQEDVTHPFKKWSIEDYNGFKLLTIHYSNYGSTIITSNSSNQLKTLLPAKTFINEEASLILPKKKKIVLNGNWKCIKRIQVYDRETYPNRDTIFNPFHFPEPPPPLSQKPINLNEFTLNLTPNSITINRYGRLLNLSWQTTQDQERIILYNKKQKGVFRNEYTSWEVLNLNDSLLKVKMNSRGSTMAKDIATFKKIN